MGCMLLKVVSKMSLDICILVYCELTNTNGGIVLMV